MFAERMIENVHLSKFQGVINDCCHNPRLDIMPESNQKLMSECKIHFLVQGMGELGTDPKSTLYSLGKEVFFDPDTMFKTKPVKLMLLDEYMIVKPIGKGMVKPKLVTRSKRLVLKKNLGLESFYPVLCKGRKLVAFKGDLLGINPEVRIGLEILGK